MRRTLLLAGLLLSACGSDAVPLASADTAADVSPDVADAADVGFDADDRDAIPDASDDAVSDVAVDSTDADSGLAIDTDSGGEDAPLDADAGEDAENDAGDLGADAADADDIGAEPGFGEISGACGVIGSELSESEGSFFEAAIDFAGDPFDDPEDRGSLTPGGLAVLEAGNSGGSSLYSEVFAFEVLARCDEATLLATETTIEYRPEHTGSITDLLVEIGSERVGVSVTRAVGFPRDEPYTVERAVDLLTGKLEDILESSDGVADEDAWVKQVLFVIAYAEGHVDSLREAMSTIDAEVRADTVVFVVESVGPDEWLY